MKLRKRALVAGILVPTILIALLSSGMACQPAEQGRGRDGELSDEPD